MAAVFVLVAPVLGGQPDDGWVFVPRQKLEACDGQIRDRFGKSLAIDGDTIALAAPEEDELGLDAGAVYVFERGDDGTWSETVKIVEENGLFGSTVNLDGDTLSASCPLTDDGEGAIFFYERGEAPGTWHLTAKVKHPNPYRFQQGFGGGFLQGDEFYTGDAFDDMAAPSGGAVYGFYRHAGGPDAWGHLLTLTAPDAKVSDNFARVIVDGETMIVGAGGNNDKGIDAGAAYVYTRGEHGGWIPIQKLYASLPGTSHHFGSVKALEGDVAAFGVDNDTDNGHPGGTAYVFERDETGRWAETARITSSDGAAGDFFGETVAVARGRVLVGAPGEDEMGNGAGAVYVFEKDAAGAWVETRKLVPPPVDDITNFGAALATSGNRLLVGAPLDDSRGLDVGSAYLFELAPPTAFALRLADDELAPGERIEIATMLRYAEAHPVTAPYELLVLDATGEVVSSFVTTSRTFRPGELVPKTMAYTLPLDLPPGSYDFVAGLLGAGDDGSQPIAWDRRPFTVVP